MHVCICHTAVYAIMIVVAPVMHRFLHTILIMLRAIKCMSSTEENIIFSAYNQLVRFRESCEAIKQDHNWDTAVRFEHSPKYRLAFFFCFFWWGGT
jgi:hypothetical protein